MSIPNYAGHIDRQTSARYWLPASFSACDSLPMEFWRLLPEAKLFVSMLVWKAAMRNDHRSYSRLHSHWLTKVLGRNYAIVTKALLQSGVTQRINYLSGQKSYGYRLAPRFQSDLVVTEHIEERRIVDRLDRWQLSHERKRKENWEPIHHELDRRHRLIMIDRDNALAELTAFWEAARAVASPKKVKQHRQSRLQQSSLVEMIARGEHRLSVGVASERVTAICGLLKGSVRRSSLSCRGENLVEVDLKCSQPTLLAMLLTAERKQPFIQWLLRGIDLPTFDATQTTDARDYVDCIMAGELYETLHKSRRFAPQDTPPPESTKVHDIDEKRRDGTPPIIPPACLPSRDAVKKHVMRDVFAKNGRYPSHVEDAFKDNWPTVYKYIRSVNRQDHKKMLVVLQTIEARLVSCMVCGLLADRIKPDVGFFSVHDCVALPEVHQAAAHAAFANVSHQLDFPLRVETK